MIVVIMCYNFRLAGYAIALGAVFEERRCCLTRLFAVYISRVGQIIDDRDIGHHQFIVNRPSAIVTINP